jgi:hypothetical protein
MNSLSVALAPLLARTKGAAPPEDIVNAYELVFPVIAFILVIMLPVATGMWVLVRTVKNTEKEADET